MVWRFFLPFSFSASLLTHLKGWGCQFVAPGSLVWPKQRAATSAGCEQSAQTWGHAETPFYREGASGAEGGGEK